MSRCTPIGGRRYVEFMGGPFDGLRMWLEATSIKRGWLTVTPPQFLGQPIERVHRYELRPREGKLVHLEAVTP